MLSNPSLDPNDLLSSFIPPRKKRGRKSKAEKEAEVRAATEAAVTASYHRIVGLDVEPDIRIPMICLEVSSLSQTSVRHVYLLIHAPSVRPESARLFFLVHSLLYHVAVLISLMLSGISK